MCEDVRIPEESDAKVKSEDRFYPTGDGYIVYRVWLEWDPMYENHFIAGHKLVGFAEVDDWPTIREVLRSYDYDESLV